MVVGIFKDENISYNKEVPFNPSIKYPEYPFNHYNKRNNNLYESVRNLLNILKLDNRNYGKSNWNPFGRIIKPGDKVFIKPNLVLHPYSLIKPEVLLTDGGLIRVILDYVYIALKGEGSIAIGDSPLHNADFNKITKYIYLDNIIDFYNENSNIKINLIDLRQELYYKEKNGRTRRIKLRGDPLGYSIVNIKNSEFLNLNINFDKYRITNYDKKMISLYHNLKKNEYLVSNSILNSNVIINIPKLKTHSKAGFSNALKNMIGICGDKSCLPHHRFGSIEENGDEYLYKSTRKKILTILNEYMDCNEKLYENIINKIIYNLIKSTKYILPFKDPYFEGSWYGNDTISRTITDLNKIVLYGNSFGVLKNKVQRKMIIIVDGIIVGEKEGPLKATKNNCGVITIGFNPLEVDLVCSQIIGFDYQKIPTIKRSLGLTKFKLYKGGIDAIQIRSEKCSMFKEIISSYNCMITPSEGWKGHIEKNI